MGTEVSVRYHQTKTFRTNCFSGAVKRWDLRNILSWSDEKYAHLSDSVIEHFESQGTLCGHVFKRPPKAEH